MNTATAPKGGLLGGIIDTSHELTLPPPEPDAHRAAIVSVTSEVYETGTTSLNFALTSLDGGFAEEYKIFLPNAFVEDINVDPTTLSDVPVPGKKQSPRQRYAQVVHNSDNRSELDLLFAIAAEQGRNTDGMERPKTFEDFVNTVNTLFNGLEVIFLRNVEESEQYGDRLKVRKLVSPTLAHNPKALKKYKKAWENN